MKNLQFLMLIAIVATLADASNLLKSFEDFQVIPDVISQGPREILEAKYNPKVSVNFGNELTPFEVKDQPKVEWKHEKDALYTLLLTDPDAPSRAEPKLREFNHWLVGNIPANDISKGDTIYEYMGSGPPKGTGLHRYVFLVYKQTKKLNFDEPHVSKTDKKSRPNFSTKKFVEKYSLGTPIAGNFFQAKWDEYVSQAHN